MELIYDLYLHGIRKETTTRLADCPLVGQGYTINVYKSINTGASNDTPFFVIRTNEELQELLKRTIADKIKWIEEVLRNRKIAKNPGISCVALAPLDAKPTRLTTLMRVINTTDTGDSSSTLGTVPASTTEFANSYKREGTASHYQDIVPGYQYVDLLPYLLKGKDPVEAADLTNIYSYLFRLGKKDSELQEMKKVLWYVSHLLAYYILGKTPFFAKDVKSIIAKHMGETVK